MVIGEKYLVYGKWYKLVDVTENKLFRFERKGNKAVCYSLFEIRQMIAKGDIR